MFVCGRGSCLGVWGELCLCVGEGAGWVCGSGSFVGVWGELCVCGCGSRSRVGLSVCRCGSWSCVNVGAGAV